MKKIILSLLLAASLAAPTISQAETLQMRGDSLIVVQGTDTVAVSNFPKVIRELSRDLDDTIVGKREWQEAQSQANEIEQRYAYNENQYELRMALKITALVVTAILIIIFVSLTFWYMNRRRKYKVIEKAIMNNYELPTNLFDGDIPRPQPVPVVYPTAPSAAPVQPTYAYMDDSFHMNWNAKGIRDAYYMIVGGICGMIFFSFVGAEFMIGMCMVPLLFGLGRGLLAYQEQRNAYYTMLHQQRTQAEQKPQTDSNKSENQPPQFPSQQ